MCLDEQFLTKSFGRSSRFNHEVFTVTASAADQEIQAFLTSLHELLFGVKHPLTSSREGRKGLLDQVQANVLTQDWLPADWPRLTGGLPGGGFLASSSLSMRLISCSAELGSMAKEWQRSFDQPFHEVALPGSGSIAARCGCGSTTRSGR